MSAGFLAALVCVVGGTIPQCGRTYPSALRDRDAICVQLQHDVWWLGDLELLNSTAERTRISGLPRKLLPKTRAWLSVQDGV